MKVMCPMSFFFFFLFGSDVKEHIMHIEMKMLLALELMPKFIVCVTELMGFDYVTNVKL